MRKTLCFAALLGALSLSPLAHAEQADRSKPVKITADRVSVDDKNKVQIFEGSVVLTQGTLTLHADKIVVSQDQDGFQKGVATSGAGGLARFRQKREAKNEYIEGEAEKIVYNAKNDTAQLFNRAKVVSGGRDEVSGQYIDYDGYNEIYQATNGPNATVVSSAKSRVSVTIQPKKSAAKPAASAP
jgi:lipopolysaccharide export system protein LptA